MRTAPKTRCASIQLNPTMNIHMKKALPSARWLLVLAALVCLRYSVMPTRADSLFFVAQAPNFSWFSVSNWFQPNTYGQLVVAAKIPAPGDNAFITTPVIAAANAINLASLVLEPGVTVTGGAFTCGQVAMTAGSIFMSSYVQVQAQMYVSGMCGLTDSRLGIDPGAFCALYGPQTGNGVGTLFLASSSIINDGEIILTNGSSITGGTNLVNRGYITASGTNTVSGAAGTFDNSGVVRSYGGILSVGPFVTWTNSSGAAQYQTLAPGAVITFPSPGPTIPANATNFFTGSGILDFPYGAVVDGVLQVGAVDPTTMALNPGTVNLSSEAVTLVGAGLIHVIGDTVAGSVLNWLGGTISLPQVIIDAGAHFNLSGSADKTLSGTVVNNAGVATTKMNGEALHLNNGAVFLNTGLFDAQNDAPIVGSGGAKVGLFDNRGIFRKSAGTNDTFFASDNTLAQAPVFNNSGLVEVQTGRLVLLGGTNSGQCDVSAGARLRFFGLTNVQTAAASFSGPGEVAVDGNNVLWLLTGSQTIPNFFLGNGLVDGPGSLTVTSAFTWAGGGMQGTGVANIDPGATLSITATSTLNRVLNNGGTAITSAGSAVVGGNGAVWNNLSGGVLNLQSSATWDYTGAGGKPVFQNSGTVSNSATFSSAFNWAFTNNGVVWVHPTALSFLRGFTQLNGLSRVDAGGNLKCPAPALVLILGGILEGEGTVQGNLANWGTIHPGDSPGTLQVNGNFTNFPGGTLAVEIGGRVAGTNYSQLAGNASATLGGNLAVSFANAFTPVLGDRFTILSGATILSQSTFGSLSGLRLGNGLVLVPVYTPMTVTLVAANDPILATAAWSGSQFTFTFLSTPGLTNTVQYTDSLSPPAWQTLTTIAGDGTVKSIADAAAGAPNRFYRLLFQ